MNNMRNKILMTLALLITAVGGAWADETLLLTIESKDYTSFTSGSKTFDDKVTVTFSKSVLNVGNAKGWFTTDASLLTVAGTNGYTITSCKFYTQSGTAMTGYTVQGESPSVYLFESEVYTDDSKSVNIGYYGVMKIEVYYTTEPAGPTVTLNEAKTIASFEMPTYDVDVDYELVRDMSVQMQAQVGDDPAKEPRYRVQWNDEKETFEPAEMDMMQVLALFSVNDLIEKTTLAQTSYFVNIYAVDAEGNPTGNAMDFTNFTFAPGRYCVTATGGLGGPYDGTTAPSNIFELYQGYQVVIPAGEYVTYYKDEAVRLEEKDKNDIELCTITAVEDGKAVLSDNFDAMKANTPFLLKNTTSEEKTILLIPCNEPELAVTVAKEFKGTEGPCVFSEELMATGDFYVCNGKEFIKVRGAGTLAANKAFLFVEGNNTPASIPFRRSIGGEGEGTTSIDNLNVNDNLNDNEATWYDLNGRKLNGKPAQKGIYIKNGKKVVVH